MVARATLLLEVALFVHRCNRGDWPEWMRLNLPGAGVRMVGVMSGECHARQRCRNGSYITVNVTKMENL